MRSEKECSLLPNALDVLNRKTVKFSKAVCIQASTGIDALIGGASPAESGWHQILSDRPESNRNGPARKIPWPLRPSLGNRSSVTVIKLTPACLCTHPIFTETEKGAEHAASA